MYNLSKHVFNTSIMATNETYKRKVDEQGNFMFDEKGDPIMELVSSIEVPDIIIPPNWTKLKSDLLTNPSLASLLPQTNPQGFTIFNTFLTDGQNGHSDQRNFPIYFNYMGLTLTDIQKNTI